jgi:hypothetical protein
MERDGVRGARCLAPIVTRIWYHASEGRVFERPGATVPEAGRGPERRLRRCEKVAGEVDEALFPVNALDR